MRVSRRALRGSDAELGALARMVSSEREADASGDA
jgi:hypothetical protein